MGQDMNSSKGYTPNRAASDDKTRDSVQSARSNKSNYSRRGSARRRWIQEKPPEPEHIPVPLKKLEEDPEDPIA